MSPGTSIPLGKMTRLNVTTAALGSNLRTRAPKRDRLASCRTLPTKAGSQPCCDAASDAASCLRAFRPPRGTKP
eukprot:scaffold188265_cov22-Tisochrysis_lutea.AAC.1